MKLIRHGRPIKERSVFGAYLSPFLILVFGLGMMIATLLTNNLYQPSCNDTPMVPGDVCQTYETGVDGQKTVIDNSSYSDMLSSEQTNGDIVASVFGLAGLVGSIALFAYRFTERDEPAAPTAHQPARQKVRQGS